MNFSQASILVIDDNTDVLFTLKLLLKHKVGSVVLEDSPQQIATRLQSQKFDLALLDMNYALGETDGAEGLYWLRCIREQAPHIRVIMMTAYGDIDLAIRAIKEGASDFVVKPWENDKLVATLEKAYKQPQAPSPVIEDSPIAPVTELERIFMFLDIRSSTHIAEQLGHTRYFELLNDFFSDISDPILSSQGEIYQYVGDEVVVSWPLVLGLADAKCIRCFFNIEKSLQMKAKGYQEKYGLVPDFKAGFHAGKVSAGTIGKIKKEKVYTGDVLNTTSRIEGLCNTYNVNLLLSETLYQLLPESEIWHAQRMGAVTLRGKEAPTALFHLSLKSALTSY